MFVSVADSALKVSNVTPCGSAFVLSVKPGLRVDAKQFSLFFFSDSAVVMG